LNNMCNMIPIMIVEKPNFNTDKISFELFIAMKRLTKISRNADMSIFAYVFSSILLSPPFCFIIKNLD